MYMNCWLLRQQTQHTYVPGQNIHKMNVRAKGNAHLSININFDYVLVYFLLHLSIMHYLQMITIFVIAEMVQNKAKINIQLQ